MFNKCQPIASTKRRTTIRRIVVTLVAIRAVLALALVAGCVAAVAGLDEPLERIRTLPVPPAAQDLSPGFQAFQTEAGFDAAAIDIRFAQLEPELTDVRFIIMPSYLSDFLDVPHDLGLLSCFVDQVDGLRAAGYTVTLVDTESEATIEHSAALLRVSIEADDRPICILSHSKGGMDTLEFLIRADAAMRSRVVCWIAFQAPFAGSPIADGVASVDLLRWPSKQALALFGVDGQSLHNLRTDERGA